MSWIGKCQTIIAFSWFLRIIYFLSLYYFIKNNCHNVFVMLNISNFDLIKMYVKKLIKCLTSEIINIFSFLFFGLERNQSVLHSVSLIAIFLNQFWFLKHTKTHWTSKLWFTMFFYFIFCQYLLDSRLINEIKLYNVQLNCLVGEAH